MKHLLKWLTIFVGVLIIATLGVLATAYISLSSARSTQYAINDPPLVIPADSHSLAHGAHLYATRGCADCHQADGRGHEVMDAGPVGRMVAANITPAALQARGYGADAIAAAIRHGVRADGTPLLFMPSEDWHELGDADTAALVAYVQTLPDQAHDPGQSEIRPLGALLHLFGELQPFPAAGLDHTPRSRQAPEAKVSVEYGGYLATTCAGCHGEGLKGGIQFAPHLPTSSDLTPAALGAWSEDDFLRAMRQGKRPDGSDIDPFMPWQSMGKMSEVELRALWAYLKQLPTG